MEGKMEILRTFITLSVVLAGVAFLWGMAHMAGLVGTAYRITPGGWLSGAQTLLLFGIALYCMGRSARW
jgi:hypothetical protein